MVGYNPISSAGSTSVPPIDSGSARLLYDQPLTGFDEQWVEITEAGDLVLSDPCCDGFVYEWHREQ